MIASVAINEHIFNLLIKKGLDHFSVTDLRDELMNENQDLGDGSEARKFVYRQLLRLVEKGYLEKRLVHQEKWLIEKRNYSLKLPSSRAFQEKRYRKQAAKSYQVRMPSPPY